MRLFISYRRADLGGHADAHVGRLYDKLADRFGAANVFVDEYAIPGGANFAREILTQIARADLVLVVIGPDWVQIMAERDPAEDYVVIEVGIALAKQKPLIPIFIGGGEMPTQEQLPTEIRELQRLNGVSIGTGVSLSQDVDNLIGEIIRSVPVSTIKSQRFDASAESENSGNRLKYRIREKGKILSYADVLDLWEHDSEFVNFYLSAFKKCGYYAFIWETPSICTKSVRRDFEFVIHNSPISSRQPDRETYAEYFDTDTAPDGIVAFDNLRGDALLVVPSPYRKDADYSGLAEFFLEAPVTQQRGLWRELARHAKSRLSGRPMWLSVAGGGIHWLHIRLDSTPKYYRYEPYTVPD